MDKRPSTTLCGLVLFLLITSLAAQPATDGIYAYPAPTDKFPASPYYRVMVQQGEHKQENFVYLSRARTEGPGTQFVQGRTLSYTGFMASGVVEVEVELLSAADWEPGRVQISPSRFGIEPSPVKERTVRFELDREGQFVLTFGEEGYRHGLVIAYDPWTGAGPDKENPNVLVVSGGSRGNPADQLTNQHTLYFSRGLHELGGRIDLPPQIKSVYLEPGAFIYGAIYVPHANVHIYGRGVLCSERLAHREAHSLETPPEARNVLIEGITVADYAQFAVRTLGRNNTVRWVKCVGGWVYNADGLVGWAGTTLRNNFIHADDDAIKLYDDDVLVEDCVIWQMTNGACLQLGWHSLAAERVRVRNIDVVRTEWRSNGGANNSVINLRLRSGRETGQVQRDFLFENIFVETPVDRFLDLRFRDKKEYPGKAPDGGKHRLEGFYFKNIHVPMTDNAFTGNYLLPYDEVHGYRDIRFEGLYVNDTLITSQNFKEVGRFILPEKILPELAFIKQD